MDGKVRRKRVSVSASTLLAAFAVSSRSSTVWGLS